MTELLDGISDLRSSLKRLNLSGKELEAGVDLFDESGFDEDINFLNLSHERFSIDGEPANYRVVSGDDVVDMEAVYRGILDGDLLKVVDELKFPKDSLPPKVTEYIDKFKSEWEMKRGIKDVSLVNKMALDGQAVESEVGFRIDNTTHLEAALDMNEELNTKFQKDLKAVREKFGKGRSQKMGKWVKRTVILTAAGVGLAEIWKMINDHKKAMNGCWMVNKVDGSKCKITTLSKCGDGATDAFACSADNRVCGLGGTDDCFQEGKCLSHTNGSCVEAIQACTSGECSKHCGSVAAPLGYITHCVNVNFWGAANDYFDDILSPTHWFKWMMYIGVAVVVVVVVTLLLK